MSCRPKGIRQDRLPGTTAAFVIREPRQGESDLLFRVRKPVQKPRTHPRTMENCSSARIDPRTSGGLISAMYKGESVLRVGWTIECFERRKPRRPYLNAPTPMPPIALPPVSCVKERAHVCNAEPTQKTAFGYRMRTERQELKSLTTGRRNRGPPRDPVREHACGQHAEETTQLEHRRCKRTTLSRAPRVR
jgi:hypothetical protein